MSVIHQTDQYCHVKATTATAATYFSLGSSDVKVLPISVDLLFVTVSVEHVSNTR